MNILITGANKGLGFELAKQLAKLNHNIFLTARNQQKGIDAVKKLESDGLKATFLHLDVTSQESIDQCYNEYLKYANSLDILINNAGIMPDKKGVLEITEDVLQKNFQTNTIGPLMMIQKFHSIINKGGKIINFSSQLGSITNMRDYSAAYSIAKAALNAITKLSSEALKNKGISVNSIHPGWVKTDMGGSEAPMNIEEGIQTALWLATELPSNITGKFFHKQQELPW